MPRLPKLRWLCLQLNLQPRSIVLIARSRLDIISLTFHNLTRRRESFYTAVGGDNEVDAGVARQRREETGTVRPPPSTLNTYIQPLPVSRSMPKPSMIC